MLKSFFQNASCPGATLGGRMMLRLMNFGHQGMLMWARNYCTVPPAGTVLDIGCGGGRNIANLLKMVPGAKFHGIDLSPQSVQKSIAYNRAAVQRGQVEIREGSVERLPYREEMFDLAIASETIYFWPDLAANFSEVFRVLKPGGTFVICNEVTDSEAGRKWAAIVNGMRVYSTDRLKVFLAGAGFSEVLSHTHPNCRWFSITARRDAVAKR